MPAILSNLERGARGAEGRTGIDGGGFRAKGSSEKGGKDQGERDTVDCARAQRACGSVPEPHGLLCKAEITQACVLYSDTGLLHMCCNFPAFSAYCGKRKYCTSAENILSLDYV